MDYFVLKMKFMNSTQYTCTLFSLYLENKCLYDGEKTLKGLDFMQSQVINMLLLIYWLTKMERCTLSDTIKREWTFTGIPGKSAIGGPPKLGHKCSPSTCNEPFYQWSDYEVGKLT